MSAGEVRGERGEYVRRGVGRRGEQGRGERGMR